MVTRFKILTPRSDCKVKNLFLKPSEIDKLLDKQNTFETYNSLLKILNVGNILKL